MKLPYEPAKTLLLITGGWTLVGALPRLAGIAVPKPQFVQTLRIADITIVTLFFSAVLYTITALVLNAKNAPRGSSKS